MQEPAIDKLILSSPYDEPTEHWHYNPEVEQFEKRQGRRPASFVRRVQGSKTTEVGSVIEQIPLANQIRNRVRDWRQRGHPGVTSTTKRLIQYWYDETEHDRRRFFFAQLEAIETLIWLNEVADNEGAGIEIISDGGEFQRICSKMATGTGKTVVMAMLIAWQVLNKVNARNDGRFSKNVFVVAPGLTVKNRLAVLKPSNSENYYDQFHIVPVSMRGLMNQVKIQICNWHKLGWANEEAIAKKKSIDKRGPLSDKAYAREVLGDLSDARDLLVINDEAHHAWRLPSDAKTLGLKKNEIQDATVWISGLDRLHRTCGVHCCYDFTATPFIPSNRTTAGDRLFSWIVSDFGLSDSIESGLVKTPRIVVRDDALPDATTYKSKLFHLYADPEVHDDLNRRAKPDEILPDLVINAYTILGTDWLQTMKLWEAQAAATRPVMISVANRTETAARIKNAFDSGRIGIDELIDPTRTLHIDSKMLAAAEEQEEETSVVENGNEAAEAPVLTNKQQRDEYLRKQVDTVGKVDQPGEKIQNVISVSMLSEGWDAKTVTHIMGLRAFTSQLLCEQVVGRGLRRTSYDINEDTQCFDPEYVNVFGIPFSFLPQEAQPEGCETTPKLKTRIYADATKLQYEMSWPNVLNVMHSLKTRLAIDWNLVEPLEIDAKRTILESDVAPVIEGETDEITFKQVKIAIRDLENPQRLQTVVYLTAAELLKNLDHEFQGSMPELIKEIIRLTGTFLKSDKIVISSSEYRDEPELRAFILAMNMTKIIRHIWGAIINAPEMKPELVFDEHKPIVSTSDMADWYTAKKTVYGKKSHINRTVCDSSWEAAAANLLDQNKSVAAWVKNDHIGFLVHYVHNGVVRKYLTDFLVRLKNGRYIVIEVKGKERSTDESKKKAMMAWINGVNAHRGFGRWHFVYSTDIAQIEPAINELS